jgi:hypothetical protein
MHNDIKTFLLPIIKKYLKKVNLNNSFILTLLYYPIQRRELTHPQDKTESEKF